MNNKKKRKFIRKKTTHRKSYIFGILIHLFLENIKNIQLYFDLFK